MFATQNLDKLMLFCEKDSPKCWNERNVQQIPILASLLVQTRFRAVPGPEKLKKLFFPLTEHTRWFVGRFSQIVALYCHSHSHNAQGRHEQVKFASTTWQVETGRASRATYSAKLNLDFLSRPCYIASHKLHSMVDWNPVENTC
jgi:hypothetical protein